MDNIPGYKCELLVRRAFDCDRFGDPAGFADPAIFEAAFRPENKAGLILAKSTLIYSMAAITEPMIDSESIDASKRELLEQIQQDIHNADGMPQVMELIEKFNQNFPR